MALGHARVPEKQVTRNRWGNRSKFLVTLAASHLLLAACGRSDTAEGPPAPERPATEQGTMTEKPPVPEVPKPLQPVDRALLIAAADAAADASAAGLPPPARNTALVNRSFELRLPFGCDGPSTAPDQDWAGWTYDPQTRALKLTARPENWQDAEWLASVAPDKPADAIEGFWLRRPWTRSESCPPAAPEAEAPAVEAGDPAAGGWPDATRDKPPAPARPGEAEVPAETPAPVQAEPAPRETLGIARFVSPGAARTLTRGDRPYAVTLKQSEGFTGDPAGYRLVLSGRITGFAGGQPVRCWNGDPSQRPICIAAAEFVRVAIEDSRGNVLVEWLQ